MADFEAEWARLEAAAQPAVASGSSVPILTQRQVVAIAGEFYRLIGDEFIDNPGDSAFWARKQREGEPEAAASGDEDAAPPDGPSHDDDAAVIDFNVRQLLAQHGIAADQPLLDRIRPAVRTAEQFAYAQLRRQALGDYSPDPNVPASRTGRRLRILTRTLMRSGPPM